MHKSLKFLWSSISFSFFFKFILFIYLWLCWVLVPVWGLSPVVASGGHSSSQRVGLSPPRPHLLRTTGSRRTGSATVAHGSSRSAACGILPDQGSNPCPLHWQADSQPQRHQGSPSFSFVTCIFDVISKKTLPSPVSWSFPPIFSSKSFIVLALTLRSLFHFELILYMV